MAVGLYLHYPNFTPDKRQLTADADRISCSFADTFFRALRTETELVAEAGGNLVRRVNAIYIGGGTPSSDQVDNLHLWLDQTGTIVDAKEPIELSLALAPERLNRHLLETVHALGVTRLDFRVESFDRRFLRLLGRRQTTHQVHEAVYLANAFGFTLQIQ